MQGTEGGRRKRMIPSAHRDTFARDNLPPRGTWPDLVFSLPELVFHNIRKGSFEPPARR